MVSIPPPDPSGAMGSGTVTPAATTSLGRLRRRMLAGLLLIMPFVVTFWIVMSIYSALEGYIISPAARLVVQLVEGRSGGVALPPWFVHFGAPVLGVIGVAVLLLLFGTIARSGLLSLFDRVLLQVPVIKVIHGAVSRVFRFLQGQSSLPEFKRAVLVAFPHPGMRVPAFVTASCRDVSSQKTILCVYVPTTPIPTSGYMILIPEEEVTELDWGLDETIEAVVSFGITAPTHVRYYRSNPAHPPPPSDSGS